MGKRGFNTGYTYDENPAKGFVSKMSFDKLKIASSNFPLGTAWMKFYMYFRLPVSTAILGLNCLITILFKYEQVGSQPYALLELIINICLFTFLIILMYYMFNFSKTGYYLNFVLITIESAVFPLKSVISLTDLSNTFEATCFAAFATVMISSIWFIPNIVYFVKRKSLFGLEDNLYIKNDYNDNDGQIVKQSKEFGTIDVGQEYVDKLKRNEIIEELNLKQKREEHIRLIEKQKELEKISKAARPKMTLDNKLKIILTICISFALITLGVFFISKALPQSNFKKCDLSEATYTTKVYITPNGKKFHSSMSCPTLHNSQDIEEIIRSEVGWNKKPCSVCWNIDD